MSSGEKGTIGENGQLAPEVLCYLLGQAVRAGDGDRAHELLVPLVEAGVVLVDHGRHEVWRLEGDPDAMPDPSVGFCSRGHAWACWLGQGSPPEVELRFLVDPTVMSEQVFAASREPGATGADDSAGRLLPRLRLVRGGAGGTAQRGPGARRWPDP